MRACANGVRTWRAWSHRSAHPFRTKMDYVGISVLIWGSYFPIVHYFFLCDWHLQLLYLGAISLASVATICVSVMDRFAHGNVFK